MKKIEKKRISGRTLTRILLVAAILALTMTVLAAEKLGAGAWFLDILRDRGANQREVKSIVEFLDEIGQVYQESLTDQGTILTPVAAYGDENVFYLRLRVTGPKGTALPEDARYTLLGRFDEKRWMTDNPNELYLEVTELSDPEPNDNEKDFLITVISIPGSGRKLNDGNPVLIYIQGLYREEVLEGAMDAYHKILPGEFTLDLAYYNQVEMTKLDAEGISYRREETGMEYTDLWSEEMIEVPYAYSVTLRDIRISPMSISWECDYAMSDPSWKAALDLQIVMKDGSKVSMRRMGSEYNEEHPFAAGMGIGIFDYPIDLEQIDYILIGEEYKVFLPAE